MKKFLLILLFALFFNCLPDAPRSNPLDLGRGNSPVITGDISGQTLHKLPPHKPIDNCLVLLMPDQYFEYSDSNGRFTFENIKTGQYFLITDREGYSADSLAFNTDTLDGNPLILFLNGLPGLVEFHLYSQFIDQWWPDPVFFIDAEIRVTDPDGVNDIQNIQLNVPELNILQILVSTVKPDSFFLRLQETDFPDNNVFSAIGNEFHINLTDNSDSKTSEGPFFIYRIINSSPVPTEPIGLASVGPRPLLKWDNYTATFPFSFEVHVFLISGGIPILIHHKKSLSETELQYQYPDSLASGNYFWTVGVRDNLGNFSRSKEASFLVQ